MTTTKTFWTLDLLSILIHARKDVGVKRSRLREIAEKCSSAEGLNVSPNGTRRRRSSRSLSHVLKNYEDRGWILRAGRYVQIVNRDALKNHFYSLREELQNK